MNFRLRQHMMSIGVLALIASCWILDGLAIAQQVTQAPPATTGSIPEVTQNPKSRPAVA